MNFDLPYPFCTKCKKKYFKKQMLHNLTFRKRCENLTWQQCSGLLIEKEMVVFRDVTMLFRAQGRLTPEKLKLLKELAKVCHVGETGFKAMCKMAVNDEEMSTIANLVAGPFTDAEWLIQSFDPKLKPFDITEDYHVPLSPIGEAVKASVEKAVAQQTEEDRKANKPVKVKVHLPTFILAEEKEKSKKLCKLIKEQRLKKSKSPSGIKKEVRFKEELNTVRVIKEEKEDDDYNFTASQPQTNLELNTELNEEKLSEGKPKTLDPDTVLMPPPPPVSSIPGTVPAHNVPPDFTNAPPTSPSTPPNSPSALSTSTSPTATSTSSIAISTSPIATSTSSISISTSRIATSTLSTATSTSSTVLLASVVPSPSPTDLTICIDPIPSPTSSSLPPTSTTVLTPSPPVISFPLPFTPPVITVPPAPVITIPPSANITFIPAPSETSSLSLSPNPSVVSVSSLASVSQSTLVPFPSSPILAATQGVQQPPLLSDDEVQFVIVPPPEPVITVPHASSFPPSHQPPTIVLSPGMSLQLKENDGESGKRKRTQSLTLDTSSPAKTLALSPISKVTTLPVMVSAAVTSQTQAKFTPTIISRSRPPAQPTLASSQKVIIVSSSSDQNPMIQRQLNALARSVKMPLVRASSPQARLLPAPGVGQGSSGLAKLRPKMVPAATRPRGKTSPLIIPVSGNAQFHLKAPDTTPTVGEGSTKSGQAKILPKPQSSMFLVNTSQGEQKFTTTSPSGTQSTRMLSATTTTTSVGKGKHNVVILQKGAAGQRAVTLTNPSKELMQKLMSKKCVLIHSSKAPAIQQTMKKQMNPTPKIQITQSPRPSLKSPLNLPVRMPLSQTAARLEKKPVKSPLVQSTKAPAKLPVSQAAKAAAVKSTTPFASSPQSGVVVLDLSHEQCLQSMNSTILEILQASGISSCMTSSSTKGSAPSQPAPAQVPSPSPSMSSSATQEDESDWLSADTRESLSLEEVSLDLGQSESIVTLEKAVDLISEGQSLMQEPVSMENEAPGGDHSQDISGDATDTSVDQLFDLTEDDFVMDDLSFMNEKPLYPESVSSQDISEALTNESALEIDAVPTFDSSGQLAPHKDGAVTIQHSSTDVPANLSLEEYSSQQLI